MVPVDPVYANFQFPLLGLSSCRSYLLESDSTFNSLFWACESILHTAYRHFAKLSIPSFGLAKLLKAFKITSLCNLSIPSFGLDKVCSHYIRWNTGTFNSLFWAWARARKRSRTTPCTLSIPSFGLAEKVGRGEAERILRAPFNSLFWAWRSQTSASNPRVDPFNSLFWACNLSRGSRSALEGSFNSLFWACRCARPTGGCTSGTLSIPSFGLGRLLCISMLPLHILSIPSFGLVFLRYRNGV